MTNYLLFAVLPYVSLAVFLIGSIYRYRRKGFSVSSISSQFLEGRELFWASQPFHWGLMIVFFGHLTAFLIPKTVLAWNGDPVRLIILEVSAFSFGLASLIGLLLLIYRRITTRRLHVVTSPMDIVVYIILLTQLVTGVLVAYFDRWGSSWFAAFFNAISAIDFCFRPTNRGYCRGYFTVTKNPRCIGILPNRHYPVYAVHALPGLSVGLSLARLPASDLELEPA
ncbi:MAG: nitrate reductase, gamma subunit [Chlorobi bacterium OLB6]|nr:MAG: nitrate reductase, gamma subunit [Chlorobi bacterium OLB6]